MGCSQRQYEKGSMEKLNDGIVQEAIEGYLAIT